MPDVRDAPRGPARPGVAAPPTASELDAIVRTAFASGASPGLAVAVVEGDRTTFAGGYGYADVERKIPVTPETVFYLASTGKAFTALEAQIAAERGAVSLDATLAALLPGVALHEPLDRSTITLRDLLTHTHGIANDGPVSIRAAYTGEGTSEEMTRLLRFHPPAAEGRAFRYGNIGYDVAGLVLDRVVKGGWRAGIEREVLAPLGMKRSAPRVSRFKMDELAQPYEHGPGGFERIRFAKADRNMNASGGELSTALDMARFLRAHLNDGMLDGRRVLPARVARESRRLQAEQKKDYGEMAAFGWGLGWDLSVYEGDTLASRFGGFPGFRSHVSYMPSRGVGVVVLVNGGGMASPLADHVALALYDRLLDRPDAGERLQARLERQKADVEKISEMIRKDRERRAARDQRLPHPLAAYTGVYESPEYGRMQWAIKGERLEVTMGTATCRSEVFDGTTNKLRVELLGAGNVVEFSIPAGAERATALKFLDTEFRRIGS